MRRSIAIALVLGSVGLAAADNRVDAERYFRNGEKAYRAQNFEGAAANFEEAYKALAIPEIAFSAAQAYRRQYRVDGKAANVARAVVLYRAYLDKVKTGGRVADAADALGEMQHELDKLIKAGAKVSPELAAEHTQLGVNVALDGDAARPAAMREIEDAPAAHASSIVLTIDGKDATPFTPINVAPGPHRVHVEAEGYFPVDRQEPVAQGALQMIDVALQPKPAKVAIATDGDARISVDGRPVTRAFDLVAGRHWLAILADGHEPVAHELVVERGQVVALREPLVRTWKRRAVPRLVIAGSAAAGVAAISTILALVEDHRASSLHAQILAGDQHPSVGEDYNGKLAWRGRFVDGIWTFGAIAAVLGASAALLYYTDKPSLEAVHVEPLASSSGGGAAISGSF